MKLTTTDFEPGTEAYMVAFEKFLPVGERVYSYKRFINPCIVVSVGRKYVGVSFTSNATAADKQFFNESGKDTFLFEKLEIPTPDLQYRAKLFLTRKQAEEELERTNLAGWINRNIKSIINDPNIPVSQLREIIEASKSYVGSNKKYNLRPIVHGEYVATPIKNMFNDKTAYWLSKAGYTVALYMFTVEDCYSEEDFENRLTGVTYSEYENMFQEKFERN